MLLYGLMYPIARRYFPQPWRKNVLCLSLFFYLIPVPLLKEMILSRLNVDLPFLRENVRIDLNFTINFQNDQFHLGPGIVITLIAASCMAIIAFVVIIKQLKKYFEIYNVFLLSDLHETPSPELENIFQRTKDELRIKKPVKLICSQLCDSPMTIGVFKSTILFPTSDKLNLGENDNKYILKHELIHIKNKDLLLKFLSLAALAIHWYNPICYLLYFELRNICEIKCDYDIIKGTDDTQRQRYSHLIINLACAGGGKQDTLAVGLVNSNAALPERRILEMKNARKTTRPVLSFIALVLICVVGAITAFAYREPVEYVSDDLKWEGEYAFSITNESVGQLQYDYSFTDNEGNVTHLHQVPSKIFCKHSYVDGYVKIHVKNNNGGCTFTVKNAQKCKFCDRIIEGDLVSETKYTVCPHDE